MQNNVFGVREVKDLEFDLVAIIGFFSYIEEHVSTEPWQNFLNCSQVSLSQPQHLQVRRSVNFCLDPATTQLPTLKSQTKQWCFTWLSPEQETLCMSLLVCNCSLLVSHIWTKQHLLHYSISYSWSKLMLLLKQRRREQALQTMPSES